jgi:hypothetical protein
MTSAHCFGWLSPSHIFPIKRAQECGPGGGFCLVYTAVKHARLRRRLLPSVCVCVCTLELQMAHLGLQMFPIQSMAHVINVWSSAQVGLILRMCTLFVFRTPLSAQSDDLLLNPLPPPQAHISHISMHEQSWAVRSFALFGRVHAPRIPIAASSSAHTTHSLSLSL